MASARVRYIVDDVEAATVFYTERLGFAFEMNPALAFAILSRGSRTSTPSWPSCAPPAPAFATRS